MTSLIPNESVTNATRRVDSLSSERMPVSAGSERAHSSDMSVSMAASWGRSETSAGGSGSEATDGGSDTRNAR